VILKIPICLRAGLKFAIYREKSQDLVNGKVKVTGSIPVIGFCIFNRLGIAYMPP